MFSTVRYFIKTSIVFLVIGLLTGLYMPLCSNVLKTGYGAELISAHTHLILVGGVIMMIMGVALWFFPRPEKEDTCYNPDIITASYWIMTISTALRYLSQLINSYEELHFIRWMITIFSLGQITAIIIFFFGMWRRIRSSGSSRLRELKGEKF